jgi:transposase
MKAQQTTIAFHETEGAPTTIHVNGRCNYRDEGEMRVVFANAIPIFHYAKADKAADHYAMIHLVDTGLASQQEVCAAFQCSRLTIFRSKRKFDQGGIAALVPRKTGPRDGFKINKAKYRQIVALKNKGLSHVEVASRLGLKGDAVRKALKRMGWSKPKEAEELTLGLEQGPMEADQPVHGVTDQGMSECPDTTGNGAPLVTEAEAQQGSESEEETIEEEVIRSCDTDPSNRAMDRAFARLGLLQDAAPLFRDGESIPGAGVLVAIPAIVESGILDTARKVYGSLEASFYGLRTTLLTFVLMALLRIKGPEGLKEHSPIDLGRLLGLDRVCEVKTLRRKLDVLAARNKAEIFGGELAKIRVKKRQSTLGFLYVDGHVRVYNGQRKVSKGYVTKRRLAMPATTDYWVNDQEGDPVFVITAPANEGLVKMLWPVVEEIKGLIGKDRRVSIVFDRGGWSPKLFVRLVNEGFDIVTYRKGKVEPIAQKRFSLMEEEIEGKRVEYWLHDQSVVFLKGALRLRQITRLNPTGHQTHIVTSRHDLSAVTISYRMFERWRQENFFKYTSAEYALDALVDYGVEEDDLQRLVPNPKRKEIMKKRNKLQTQIEELLQEYGSEALVNEESQRPTMRGFKIANSAVSRKIEGLQMQQIDLKDLYEKTPQKVPLKETLGDDVVHRLKREKKHLTDLLKMVAYQAETDLLGLIRAEYARAAEEGRTLIQSALKSSGDLEATEKELRITLNPLSSPHRSKVIRTLCEKLNATRTTFPGSRLRLVYDVKKEPHVTQN